MARPWVKWKFEDWRGDPRLRMCGLSARGLWADLLAYMHEGEPYGHFTIDGKVPELQDVARLVGAPVKEVAKAYAELERHGVFSRTPEGVPYSRRQVRDREMADTGRTFAERRWSPKGLPNGGAYRGAIENPNAKTSDSRPKTQESDSSTSLEFVGSPSGKPKTNRGTRWDFEMLQPEWLDAALVARRRNSLLDIDLKLEAEKFGNWAHNGGPKRDWRRAFINWCLNARAGNGSGFNGGNRSSATSDTVDRIFDEIAATRDIRGGSREASRPALAGQLAERQGPDQ